MIEEKFWLRLHKELLPVLNSIESKKNKKAWGEVLIASVLGKKVQKKYQDQIRLESNTHTKFLSELLHGFLEIKDTLEAIYISEFLVSKYPTSFKKISKINYLKFIYQAYLNELYIFETRILNFLKILEKRCKKSGFSDEQKSLHNLKQKIIKAFTDIATVRGKHVHVRRYKSAKMEQLELLDSLSSFDMISDYKEIEYKALRKKIKKEIKSQREALFKLFHINLYDEIEKLVFEKLIPHYRN